MIVLKQSKLNMTGLCSDILTPAEDGPCVPEGRDATMTEDDNQKLLSLIESYQSR